MSPTTEHQSTAFKWGLSLLAVVTVGWCAHSLGGTPAALRFYCITTAVLCLWILNLYPESLVAVMAPVLYILSGVGKPMDILAAWTSPIGWLVLGGLIMGDMMAQTGIGKRLALTALSRCGGSLEKLLWGIVLAGFLIAPFVPTGMGKAAILGIILAGICRTLGLEARSREASCLFLAGMVAVTAPKLVFYTSAIDASMLVEFMRKAGAEVTWFSFMRDNAPLGILYTVLCVLLLRLLFRMRNAPGLAALVKEEQSRLGPLQGKERKALLLLVGLAVGLATDSLHGIDTGWVMILTAGACFLPGLRLLEPARVTALPLHIVFYVVGSMSIGIAARAAGVDAAIAGVLAPLLEKSGGVLSFLAVYCSGTALLMSLTSLPAVSTFAMPLTEAGMRLGGAEQSLPYVFLYGLDQYLMPYAFGPALYIFALGFTSLRYFVLFSLAKFVLGAVFIATLAYPVWSIIF